MQGVWRSHERALAGFAVVRWSKYGGMKEKVIQNLLYNGVAWVDKPNVSDGLWACWVFNPSYPLCHFFLHSTIDGKKPGRLKHYFSDGLAICMKKTLYEKTRACLWHIAYRLQTGRA